MASRFLLAAIFLGGGITLLHAQGGPPMITDDPGTVEAGHLEINTAWVHEHRPGASSSELPLLDFNYGINDHAHVKYEISWLRVRDGTTRLQGWSNSSIGMKWRFLDEDKAGVALSTYPQLEFRNPGSSSARRGLVDDENSVLLPLQIQKAFGGLSLNADLGHVFRPSGDGWVYGLVAGRTVSRRLELMVEMHGEGAGGLAARTLILNSGARINFAGRGMLLVSVGREVRNRDEPKANWISYLGWQLSL